MFPKYPPYSFLLKFKISQVLMKPVNFLLNIWQLWGKKSANFEAKTTIIVHGHYCKFRGEIRQFKKWYFFGSWFFFKLCSLLISVTARYYDKRDAEDAVDSLNGRTYDGRDLRITLDPGRPTRHNDDYGRRRSRSRSRGRGRRRSYSRSRSR